jgi:hypothetical protein
MPGMLSRIEKLVVVDLSDPHRLLMLELVLRADEVLRSMAART